MRELPDNPGWFLRKAAEADRRGNHRRAKWLCRLQLLFEPDNYWALTLYANSAYHCSTGPLGDQEACSYYQKAISIKPDEPFAHMGLGRIHYFNCLKIVKEYSFFPEGAALMLEDARDPDESEDRRGVPPLYVGYADDHCANRKVAVKELEQGASLTEHTGEKTYCLTMAAEIRCEIDNHDGIAAFQAIIRLVPEHSPAHFHLGCAYAATGQPEEALMELAFIKAHAPELADKMASVFQGLGVSEE